MERRNFLTIGCSCGILSLFNIPDLTGQDEKKDQSIKKKKLSPMDMSQEQVKNVLKFIDASQSESVKESIFGRLGYECFYLRKLDKWIEQYTDNVDALLNRINVEHKSKYWEKLEFNADRTVLTLTGRKGDGCACSFAGCSTPPLSLCHYCCKSFQQELFGMLLGQKVIVEITASQLLGSDRCNTRIHLV